MKTIAITPCVYVSQYGEAFEAISQTWSRLVKTWGGKRYLPLTLHLPTLREQLKNFSPDVVILSGGNDIASLENTKNAAPERDEAETHIVHWAIKKKRPIIGVCRGMQFLNLYFGGSLSRIDGHVGTNHNIIYPESKDQEEVNSYHEWAIAPEGLAVEMRVLATDIVGNIEAMEHKDLPIVAIMWHPERKPIDQAVDTLIKVFLKKHL